MLETLSAVHSATESKKMGRMVTTMTEWALLAQSYIIQLSSCLVNFFKKPIERSSRPYCRNTFIVPSRAAENNRRRRAAA